MAKNIIFFGDKSIFSDNLKNMVQFEGANFYDFMLWDDCKWQFSDLSADIIFVDLDTFDINSFGEEVRSFECVFFSTDINCKVSWSGNFCLERKPLEINNFKKVLKRILL